MHRNLKHSLHAIERELSDIEAALDKPATRVRQMEGGTTGWSVPRREPRITPQRRAQLDRQGA